MEPERLVGTVVGLLASAAAGCAPLMMLQAAPAGGGSPAEPRAPAAKGTPPPLLTRATRAARLAASDDYGPCAWLSNREALYLRPAGSAGKYMLVRVAAGGATRPLDAFNRKYRDLLTGDRMHLTFEGDPGHREVVYTPPEATVAPDGKWVLWKAKRRMGGEVQWKAARLDGSAERRWPERDLEAPEAVWLRKPGAWAEIVQYAPLSNSPHPTGRWKIVAARVHRLDSPRQNRRIRVPAGVEGTVLGTLTGGEVLVVAVDHGMKRPYVVFHALDLERSPAGVRGSRVALPPGTGAWKLGLSPRGDRLVWLLGSPPGDHGIQRWSVWTSGVRGERMHCLGEHPDGQPDPERPGATLDLSTLALRWLPDGRRISFVAGSGLYVLPAE